MSKKEIQILNLDTIQRIESFRAILDEIGYSSYYHSIRAHHYNSDPWASFQERLNSSVKTKNLEIFDKLFLKTQPLSEEEFIDTFSRDFLDELKNLGVLILSKRNVSSGYVLLHCFDNYILLEKPTMYCNGKMLSSETYLEALSLDIARELSSEGSFKNFLEIGCGSGIPLLTVNKTQKAVGTELNKQSAMIAKFNLLLNNRAHKVEIRLGDLFSPVGENERFDAILFNPPYRLIPKNLRYPSPQARVGSGADGLDLLRLFLGQVSNYLEKYGTVFFSCEFPASNLGLHFAQELEALAQRFGWQIEVKIRKSITVEEQSRITAEKCAQLNPQHEFKEIYEMVCANYIQLGITCLEKSWVRIRNVESSGVIIERNTR